jgi:glycosyltransferase involved in cell wall biosynthesis
MSCALPCVATNVGDVAYLLGETGILTPPRDPEAIAQALKKLIDIGREGRMLLGEAARRRIIDHFSLEAVTQLYESLYRNTVERRLENVLDGRTRVWKR